MSYTKTVILIIICVIAIPFIWIADSEIFKIICVYIIKVLITFASLNVLLMLWLFKRKKSSEVSITQSKYVDQDGVLWGN